MQFGRMALIGATAILAAAAIYFGMRGGDGNGSVADLPPPPIVQTAEVSSAPICPQVPACAVEAPPPPPAADPVMREQRRFARNDRDDDGLVASAEYLEPRRKSFDRMDADGDGAIDFTEYSVKQRDRFAASDCDVSGTLTPAEFESTATRKDAPDPLC
ncbi:MAG: histidine kinase [Pseudomonadota bacterium]